MAGPLSFPCIYGVSTTNEWVVREFIPDKEGNPCIYHGLPLHTEYRVFVDCVAALVPQVELDGEMADQQMGLQARLMSKALRKLSGVMNKTDCTIIFINQLREKIGVMFGNPETTTGGRALKFYSSVRVEIRRSEVIKNGTEIVGNKVNIKVVKNKVAPDLSTISLSTAKSKTSPSLEIPLP